MDTKKVITELKKQIDEQHVTDLKQAVAELKTATEENKQEARKKCVRIMAEMLAPEAKQIVEMVEAKPETTQNRYGDYMAVLGDQNYKGLWKVALALALSQNGGNIQGIDSAMGILSGRIS